MRGITSFSTSMFGNSCAASDTAFMADRELSETGRSTLARLAANGIKQQQQQQQHIIPAGAARLVVRSHGDSLAFVADDGARVPHLRAGRGAELRSQTPRDRGEEAKVRTKWIEGRAAVVRRASLGWLNQTTSPALYGMWAEPPGNGAGNGTSCSSSFTSSGMAPPPSSAIGVAPPPSPAPGMGRRVARVRRWVGARLSELRLFSF